jgi:hypothetical protein
VEQTLAAVSTRADVSANDEGRTAARLGLAVIRGLLLDLVATGDRKATDRALELYASMIAERSAVHSVSASKHTLPSRRTRAKRPSHTGRARR